MNSSLATYESQAGGDKGTAISRRLARVAAERQINAGFCGTTDVFNKTADRDARDTTDAFVNQLNGST